MGDPDIQRIQHIREYCERIANTVQRYGCDFDTFASDYDYFDAVSMKIMQIGEIANSISDELKEETKTQVQWDAIRGIRNLFAHAYAAMDKEIIWAVAVQDIPQLLVFCNTILEQGREE